MKKCTLCDNSNTTLVKVKWMTYATDDQVVVNSNTTLVKVKLIHLFQ